ncbi:43237_t:CDS:2 [Gigaspora margarita]|uniref:43237_t:CDS:1 n=1 Tax=Gigaspora margarita TaxID=4874 RepID=A0ABN7VAS8_GIGMA|nr:43237_t:CDS:2 [Gigaspora margarita]
MFLGDRIAKTSLVKITKQQTHIKKGRNITKEPSKSQIWQVRVLAIALCSIYQKNDQNSGNSLSLSESEMILLLKLEVNKQMNEEHMTRDMEIDGSNDTQLETDKDKVKDLREGQMSYSRAVKKSLLQIRERKFKEIGMQ